MRLESLNVSTVKLTSSRRVPAGRRVLIEVHPAIVGDRFFDADHWRPGSRHQLAGIDFGDAAAAHEPEPRRSLREPN